MLALRRRRGIGAALLEPLRAEMGANARLWVVTSNDNLDALRSYQRRGFVLRGLRPGAVDGKIGEYGIPLRDELELEEPASSLVAGSPE